METDQLLAFGRNLGENLGEVKLKNQSSQHNPKTSRFLLLPNGLF